MSNIDYRQHFLHALNGLRAQGMSTEAILALIVGEPKKNTAATAAAAPDTEKLVPIQLANGLTKLVPSSAVTVKANTHTVQQEGLATPWAKPDGFVPDVIVEPAPKPVVSDAKEIALVPSRGTSYDAQSERYQEAWEPPANWGTPITAEAEELDAVMQSAQDEIAALEAQLAERKRDHDTLRSIRAGA